MLALSYSFFFAVHSISLITLAAHSPRSTHSLSSLSLGRARPLIWFLLCRLFFVAEYSPLQSATVASSSPSFITLVVFLLFFFGRFKRFASTPEPNGPNC
uniref:(northern house mosquito) hypothetical protein n=1 Tax=Culex pipiens TaxID=7175 RepID=A0A8D8EXI8_CULPI